MKRGGNVNNTVIKVENMTKAYKIYQSNKDRLLELFPFVSQKHTNFYALENLSFTIKKGEVVGIVGKNGAGKSTLLKIITGVSTQTEGKLEVKGKIASLLELGTGFDPELTGMENIYFQGHLMGFSKEEIDDKLEEIVTFADIGDFVHQPVKNYSSGMFARLAFSTAINVDPDILLVDEVLSVGDLRFQLKCLRKIEKLGEAGKTILFVSHDTNSVARYCNRVIWIRDHKIVMDDTPDIVIPQYRDYMIFGEIIDKEEKRQEQRLANEQQLDYLNINPQEIDFIGNEKVTIQKIWVETLSGTCIDTSNEKFKYVLEMKCVADNIQDLFISTLITNENSYPLAHHGTSFKYVWQKNQVLELEITFDMPKLKNGEYALSIDVGDISDGEFDLSLKLNNIYIFSVNEKDSSFTGEGSMRLVNYAVEIV